MGVMKSPIRAALFGVALCLLAGSLAAQAGVEVGEAAPAFSLPGSDGATHSLAQHRGKRGVVLAWFPKAFTPG